MKRVGGWESISGTGWGRGTGTLPQVYGDDRAEIPAEGDIETEVVASCCQTVTSCFS